MDVDAYQPKSSKGKGKSNVKRDGVELVSSCVSCWIRNGRKIYVHLECPADIARSDRTTLISLNRFEAKKNIALAVSSFARLKSQNLVDPARFSSLRLIIGGPLHIEDMPLLAEQMLRWIRRRFNRKRRDPQIPAETL